MKVRVVLNSNEKFGVPEEDFDNVNKVLIDEKNLSLYLLDSNQEKIAVFKNWMYWKKLGEEERNKQ